MVTSLSPVADIARSANQKLGFRNSGWTFQEGTVGTDEFETQKSPIVSIKTRLLVIVIGCLTAMAGSLAIGVMFSIYPGVMVVGAILQPRFRKLGRGLILAGAMLLSAWVLPYGVLVVLSDLTVRKPLMFGIALASVLLVGVCDVFLVIEEVRIRRRATSNKPD